VGWSGSRGPPCAAICASSHCGIAPTLACACALTCTAPAALPSPRPRRVRDGSRATASRAAWPSARPAPRKRARVRRRPWAAPTRPPDSVRSRRYRRFALSRDVLHAHADRLVQVRLRVEDSVAAGHGIDHRIDHRIGPHRGVVARLQLHAQGKGRALRGLGQDSHINGRARVWRAWPASAGMPPCCAWVRPPWPGRGMAYPADPCRAGADCRSRLPGRDGLAAAAGHGPCCGVNGP